MPNAAYPLTSAKDRLIIALDVPTAREAQSLVLRVGDQADFFKVGLQLFTAEGPAVVRDLVQSGKRIFLDLKFHDIPNTVSGAVRSAVELGVTMLTVHALGGSKMLHASVEAAKSGGTGRGPAIIAVTMLTSVGKLEMPELGYAANRVQDQVLRLATLAHTAGCDGVVASPLEVAQIRKAVGSGMSIVTPGIRPFEAKADDQARTATASEAIRAGASQLVVGRPITSAPDPGAAASQILDEIASAIR